LHFSGVTGSKLADGTGSSGWRILSLYKLNITEQVRIDIYDGISDQLEICFGHHSIFHSGLNFLRVNWN